MTERRTRRPIAQACAATIALGALVLAASPARAQIEVSEASIADLQAAMASGRATSAQITRAYLARIAAYDHAGPRLNALIRINPRALEEAEALDRERDERGPRGPLHGIPVILKDNYDASGLPTSAGTLALAGSFPPDDAFQVQKLRAAGAVILGKANMHELAYGITTVSALGGQTLSPYDLTRNPGGSSGGTGASVAASFAAIGWGSDTCGSIRIPASHNNLVGLRPTKGLSSIDGIVPLSHTQDVGGPLARTLPDLAVALDATVGPDAADPATAILAGRDLPHFVEALDEHALAGARIGILSVLFGDSPADVPVGRVVRAAIGRMAQLGADTLSVEISNFDDLISGSSVIADEFKWDLQDYLASLPDAPVGSLSEMLALGLNDEAVVPILRRAAASPSRDSEGYRASLAKRGPLRDAVVSLMNAESLDAIVYPTIRRIAAPVGEAQAGSNCQLSASTGLPALSTQAGWSQGLPVGIELLGRPFEDAHLLGLAYALESAADNRRPPHTAPPLVDGAAPLPESFTVRASGATGASIRARFDYDRMLGTLTYDVEATGVAPEDVHGVVLRYEDQAGRGSVVARLVRPGTLAGSGSLTLDDTSRARLQEGGFRVDLLTREEPFGAASAPVAPPSP